ncbi:hypothetical protein V1517DRAFT_312612 [Lipomyces orientalis]|uniref:Uncharacterized protein n=1 Tax=Lipomyces orientalis TaxID=1233043 RepID=A0ACC3TXX1_9ASCO
MAKSDASSIKLNCNKRLTLLVIMTVVLCWVSGVSADILGNVSAYEINSLGLGESMKTSDRSVIIKMSDIAISQDELEELLASGDFTLMPGNSNNTKRDICKTMTHQFEQVQLVRQVYGGPVYGSGKGFCTNLVPTAYGMV